MSQKISEKSSAKKNKGKYFEKISWKKSQNPLNFWKKSQNPKKNLPLGNLPLGVGSDDNEKAVD
jgi:hypothetical protein